MAYTLFPNHADSALQKAAREHGTMILRGSGQAIAKGSGQALAPMPGWMQQAHLRAATQSGARDVGRLASLRGARSGYEKSAALIEEAQRIDRLPRGEFRAALEKGLERKAEEIAAHEDRPSRGNALSRAQHDELARMHEVRAYIEQDARNLAGARAHEAAADAHHRAAALASEHSSESPFASHRAREATRRCNRLCHEQVDLPAPHANKAAGDGMSRPAGRMRDEGSRDPFRSQPVRDREFREPRANPDAFRESGRVYNTEFESGYDYDSDARAHPMARLFGPAQNAAAMNWPADAERDHNDSDFGPHDSTRPELGDLNWTDDDGLTGNMRQRELTEGKVPRYRPDRPYPGKAAGYDPNTSLTALSKSLMGDSGGSALAKRLDLAHTLSLDGRLGEGVFRDYVRWRDTLARATPTARAAFKRDSEVIDLIERIEMSARVSAKDKSDLVKSLLNA